MPTQPDDPVPGVLYSTPSIQKLSTAIKEIQNLGYLELGSSTSQSLVSATYTQLTAFAGVSGAGGGFTSNGSGVTVNAAGRYRVSAIVVYANTSATGARVANISSTPGSQSSNIQATVASAGTGTTTSVMISYVLPVSAGGQITLWGYQSSGAALSVLFTRLYVEQLLG